MVKTINNWNNQVNSATVSFTGGAFNVGTSASSYPINIGTGTAAKNIILGNTTGTTQLSLQTGTGNFSLASASGTIINAANLGQVTKPLQPAFDAFCSFSINNIPPGNLFWIEFDSDNFNIGNGFSSGAFTAPVSGHYLFTCGILCGPMTSNFLHLYAYIRTSSRDYLIACSDPWDQVYFVPGTLTFTGTCFTYLSQGEGANVSILIVPYDPFDFTTYSVLGHSTDSVSYFSGYLVC